MGRHFACKSIWQRIQLCQLVHIAGNSFLCQNFLSFQNFFGQCAVTYQGNFGPLLMKKPIKFLPRTSQFGQRRRFRSACIANGTRAAPLLYQFLQPIAKFCIVAGANRWDSNLAQERYIVNTLMSFSIARHQPGTIHCQNHWEFHQFHIVNQLIVRALQERRIDPDHRQHPLAGQTGRKGYGMLLGHSHIEKALGEFPIEELKPGAVFHSCGNGTQVFMRFPEFD